MKRTAQQIIIEIIIIIVIIITIVHHDDDDHHQHDHRHLHHDQNKASLLEPISGASKHGRSNYYPLTLSTSSTISIISILPFSILSFSSSAKCSIQSSQRETQATCASLKKMLSTALNSSVIILHHLLAAWKSSQNINSWCQLLG